MQGEKKFFLLGSSFVIESTFRLAISVFLVYIGWKVFGAITGVLIGLTIGFFVACISI